MDVVGKLLLVFAEHSIVIRSPDTTRVSDAIYYDTKNLTPKLVEILSEYARTTASTGGGEITDAKRAHEAGEVSELYAVLDSLALARVSLVALMLNVSENDTDGAFYITQLRVSLEESEESVRRLIQKRDGS